jgi:teichuronic acid biosynthesis glycosyltransferase TuaH
VLGLQRAVAVVAAVPMDEVPRYLAAADVGVIPLPDDTWWQVQSPMKLFEYLAMGMTVIATDIEAHRGIDGVVLCAPTVAGLADAMAEIIQRPPERVPIDLNRYSWDRAAEHLSEFLESVRHG